jgi:hypothetical protein
MFVASIQLSFVNLSARRWFRRRIWNHLLKSKAGSLGAWEPGSLGGTRVGNLDRLESPPKITKKRASKMLHADFLNFRVNLHEIQSGALHSAAGKPRIRAIGVGSSGLGDPHCHCRHCPCASLESGFISSTPCRTSTTWRCSKPSGTGVLGKGVVFWYHVALDFSTSGESVDQSLSCGRPGWS